MCGGWWERGGLRGGGGGGAASAHHNQPLTLCPQNDVNGSYDAFLAGDALCPFKWESQEQLGVISGDDEVSRGGSVVLPLSVPRLTPHYTSPTPPLAALLQQGFYAALSVNYLANRMGTDLKPTDNCATGLFGKDEDEDEDEGAGGGGGEREEGGEVSVLGAMDMGGSSTQIVYQPKAKARTQGEHPTPLTMPGENG